MYYIIYTTECTIKYVIVHVVLHMYVHTTSRVIFVTFSSSFFHSKMAESECEKVNPTSGNAAYGTSNERRVVPQSDVQECDVPSPDLQPHSSAVEELVYEGIS